jgi:hypothetical protein
VNPLIPPVEPGGIVAQNNTNSAMTCSTSGLATYSLCPTVEQINSNVPSINALRH